VQQEEMQQKSLEVMGFGCPVSGAAPGLEPICPLVKVHCSLLALDGT